MTRPRLLLTAAAAATAVAPTAALAAEGFHVYSYSNPDQGLSITLVRGEGKTKVTAGVTQLCAGPEDDPDGAYTVSAELKGKLKDEKVDLEGAAPTGGSGTARVKGKMTLKRFKGKFTLRVPIEGASTCKVAKDFSAKHTFTTGG